MSSRMKPHVKYNKDNDFLGSYGIESAAVTILDTKLSNIKYMCYTEK